MKDQFKPISFFANKSIVLAPDNDLTRQMKADLEATGANVVGFFDSYKQSADGVDITAANAADCIVINSPNYWREIATNFAAPAFVYDTASFQYIAVSDFEALLNASNDYDVLLLPFNRSNVTDMSLLSRSLSKINIRSAIIDIGGGPESDVTHGYQQNSDIPRVRRDALANVNRRCVVASIDWEQAFGRPFIQSERERGILTIGMVDGIEDFEDTDYSYDRNAYQTVEYVMTMGSDDLKFLTNKADKCTVVGLPKLFAMYHRPVDEPDTPRVMLNVNFTYGSFEEARDGWVSQAIAACDQAGADFIISQHPADKGELPADKVSTTSVYKTIAESSLVITRFSTVLIEALALGKPVIYFNPHGEQVKLYNDPMGAFDIVDNEQDLAKAIAHNLAVRVDVRKKAAQFLARKCNLPAAVAPSDLAAQRVKTLIEERSHVSFAPPKTFELPSHYVSRTEYHHYDDTDCEDEWQLEVYLHALGLMKTHGFKRIVDVGAGSGYKLIKYLGDYDTLGLELPVNVETLRKKYPEHNWQVSEFTTEHQFSADVVVCSDVIEHLVDPDDLLRFLQHQEFKYLILSTPDRDLVYPPDSPFQLGPPRNKAHQREWGFAEFRRYIDSAFDVIDHRVTNYHQATQMLICQKR
ncbi:methyltransferase domain-containing protein [Alteromonas sp. ASW11-36]|uniref:Methyltransferase domain-containing protein n=1 Tax=Alteromonas arenosi TaxID=3055817 RepID=A0ABT7SVC2_9ALTE|nr:methyltransferase domain-containing protein [Alteromonas sp. ASW11-36]MDM7860140.1 methyltransferase domain-containing protein [Alteromonas sp. ASW11-36]